MPIPSLKTKGKKQDWRKGKKKYYVKRNSASAVLNLKKTRPSGGKNRRPRSGKLLTDEIKKKVFIFIVFLFFCGVLAGLIFIAWISRQLPDPNKLMDRVVAETTKIYDRTGEEVLYEIHGDIKRTLVGLEDIPDYLEWATIAIEDKDFYNHKGISLWAIFRTAVTNVLRGERAGASTLTQQFIKNSMLTTEKSYIRKAKEALLAYKMEKKYTKDEILNMYLNEIPYGSLAYGIEAATQHYFGKRAKDLTLGEAAVMAALPQSPTRYSPYGPNRDLLMGRQQYILDQMVKQKFITEEQAEEAKQQEIVFKEQAINIKAPHFVMYIKEKLSEKYGEKMIEQGGLKIITTLDLYKQEIAEEVVTEKAEENMENYDASNAALISIDPKTGQILAMVGSKDYFDDEIDGQVNINTSLRQPGSSLKPLVFATSFLKGYTPDTIFYDVVTNFSDNEDKPYEPKNYNLEEHGPVSIRKALAGSLNIPAVKAIYLAGVNNVVDVSMKLGYTTLTDPDRYGLSLVLGGAEVKLIEHANAYGVFAREGMYNPVTGILSVEDKDGNILEEFEKNEEKVMDPKVCRYINDILSDNPARAYAFGESNWLTLGSRPVAAKTGTTNDYRDAWTIGYTPSIVTGVWVGNNNNDEMKRGAAGGVVAAPIWHDYMKKILGDTPVEQFKKPEIKKTGKAMLDGEIGATKVVKIDKSSGLLATEYTPEDMVEEKVFSEHHNILFYVDKDDPLGDAPENPEKNDIQFEAWEEAVQRWAKEEMASSTEGEDITEETGLPPTEYDNVHVPENIPQLAIVTPGQNQVLTTPLLDVRIQVSSPRGVVKTEYYLNDSLFYTNEEYPFNMFKRIDFLNNGFHNLKIKACDDVENCKEREIEFNLNSTENTSEQKVNLDWVSPSSGLAITNFDFPLSLDLKTNSYHGLAKINLYYIGEGNSAPQFISTLDKIESNNISVDWEEAPVSGTYKVYAEGVTWNKQSIKLDPIILIVNNVNKVEEETASSSEEGE